MTAEDKTPVLGYGIKGAIAVVIAVAIISVIVIMALPREESQDAGTATETEKNQTQTTQIQSAPLLRTDAITVLSDPQIDFDFEQANDVEGQENYIGMRNADYAQLIGSEDGLVKCELKIRLQEGDEGTQLPTVRAFGSVFGPTYEDWVVEDWYAVHDSARQTYARTETTGPNFYNAVLEEFGGMRYFGVTVSADEAIHHFPN